MTYRNDSVANNYFCNDVVAVQVIAMNALWYEFIATALLRIAKFSFQFLTLSQCVRCENILSQWCHCELKFRNECVVIYIVSQQLRCETAGSNWSGVRFATAGLRWGFYRNDVIANCYFAMSVLRYILYRRSFVAKRLALTWGADSVIRFATAGLRWRFYRNNINAKWYFATSLLRYFCIAAGYLRSMAACSGTGRVLQHDHCEKYVRQWTHCDKWWLQCGCCENIIFAAQGLRKKLWQRGRCDLTCTATGSLRRTIYGIVITAIITNRRSTVAKIADRNVDVANNKLSQRGACEKFMATAVLRCFLYRNGALGINIFCNRSVAMNGLTATGLLR